MALSIADRRRLYADEYRRRWRDAQIDPDKVPTVRAVAQKILASRARYERISAATGVPWWWIGITHNRESGCRFDRHLHNGDPLTARTKLVPAGRPAVGAPPFTFEESAVDALTMPGKEYHRIVTWDLVEVLLRFEQYNGFGYRSKGIPSPYVWAMTNQSNERGKYVRDGVFDPDAPERQVGCVAIMLALQDLGVAIFPDEAARPKPKTASVDAAITGAVVTAGSSGAVVVADPPAGWSTGEILVVTAAAVVIVVIVGLAVRAWIKRRAAS